jgi:hypothetical protein
VAYQCPKSVITAESITAIEEFQAWKLAGMPDLRRYPARVADALTILELEVRSEQRHE